MRLQIKNFAKIKEADITLDGITVIAGENNTGKSTVGKILYAFFNSMHNYPIQVKDQKINRINNIINNFFYVCESKYNFRNDYSKEYSKVMSEYLNQTKLEDTDILFNFFIDKYPDINKDELNTTLENVKNTLGISDKDIFFNLVSSTFNGVFYNQVNNLNNLTDAEIKVTIQNDTSDLLFSKGFCSQIVSPILVTHSAVFFDDPNTLDCLSLNKYIRSSTLTRKLRNMLSSLDGYTDETPDVISDIINNEKLKEIYALLDKANIGSLVKQERGKYMYNNNNLIKPLEIENLSIGIKAFVLLKSILEANLIHDKDVLIFDEPEIHVHPKWQILYAEVLVLLQVTFNLTLVITSHSPYFIDAINLYAAKYNALKNCNFYLSEMEDNEVTFENVTRNINKIYKKLADPFDTLDTLRYELEEEGKLQL